MRSGQRERRPGAQPVRHFGDARRLGVVRLQQRRVEVGEHRAEVVRLDARPRAHVADEQLRVGVPRLAPEDLELAVPADAGARQHRVAAAAADHHGREVRAVAGADGRLHFEARPDLPLDFQGDAVGSRQLERAR